MAKSNMRILGKPKPPQEGKFSSKVAKELVAEPPWAQATGVHLDSSPAHQKPYDKDDKK